MTILVTGGAGFIGSHFVRDWLTARQTPCVNLDKLTYAGNLHNLDEITHQNLHHFVKGDIGDRPLVRSLLEKHQPESIVHLAAETHVDRSIEDPALTIQTNVEGSFALLEEVRHYWQKLDEEKKRAFRFLNVSSSEVYGSLAPQESPCKEGHPFAPNSPYAASKAAFDHLVRSYHMTYGLPTLTAYTANTFGPYQFPEKLVPYVIINALQGKPLPLYGDGLQTRSWIYVKDLCEALRTVLEKGQPGASYNIGHKTSVSNLDLVTHVCVLMDALLTESPHRPHNRLITHVQDRRGHDRRYAIDSHKIEAELGFKPQHHFDESLLKTIIWYLDHRAWVENVMSGAYRTWVQAHQG